MKSKSVRKMLCGLLVTSSVLSVATPVFASGLEGDKDGDGKLGKVTLYKTENVQSDNSGDYLLEIKLEEGWTPYADVQVGINDGALCTSKHKGYRPLEGEEYILEDVVGATLRDVNNGGTRFRGKVTNPKEGGIIEVPINLCKEHDKGGLVGQAGIDVVVHKDNAKFYARDIIDFTDAKPISERGNEPTQPTKVFKGQVEFKLGVPVYTVAKEDGRVKTKTIQNEEAPFMSNGRVMVPIRYAGEALNANVEWDSKAGEVIVKKGSKVVRLPLNSQYAIYSDGSKADMGAKTIQRNGRTFVPVGALGRLFDASVLWDDYTNRITITLYENQ